MSWGPSTTLKPFSFCLVTTGWGWQGLLHSSRSQGQSSDVTHETLLVSATAAETRQRGSPTSPPPSPVLPGAGKRASPDTQGWSQLQAVLEGRLRGTQVTSKAKGAQSPEQNPGSW